MAIRPDGRSAAFHQTLLRTAERTSFSYRTRPGRAAYRFRLRRHDPAARPGTWTLHTSRAPRQTR